jgi:hypothetical protein
MNRFTVIRPCRIAVHKPRRKDTEPRYYVCEFVMHGKRIQESTGSTARLLPGNIGSQVDLLNRTIRVGRAKTDNRTGRVLPINDQLSLVLQVHRQWFVESFGAPRPDHYLFPWGAPVPRDPERHAREVKTAWTKARNRAKVSCTLHDLRHTYATSLAEAGVPESTMLALMGHMSRAMLERYSHIRMRAKRDAVAAIRLRPQMESSEALPVKVPVVAENLPLQ